MIPIKKILSLVLTLSVLAVLCGCNGGAFLSASSDTSQEDTVTAPTNDATFTFTPPADAELLPGGQTIVLAAGADGASSGPDAMLWQGVQTFANTYGCTAQLETAEGDSVDDAEAVLRKAAEDGAKLVVCRGDTMALALYRLQDSYPDVNYLLFDGEPHNEDLTSYMTASGVHCVLFQEEQAGYMAGYASVLDGYTNFGFVGARELPGIVRYCTGFLQGAEAAAEEQGDTVTLQTWFTDTYDSSDEITQRMVDWYNNGVQLILVSGGDLAASAADAVNQTGAKAIATDWDQTDRSENILASAIKCYNAAVQHQLYNYFSGGARWDDLSAGQTESVGVTNGEVALETGTSWRFTNFTQDDYRKLYEQLRTSVRKVEAYSDLDTLPDTPSVTVSRRA